MPSSEHKYYPQRWDEVPRKVYEPLERLKALDEDGVDGEVLFPNDPGGGRFFSFVDDAAFELACVQAYNDALAEWRGASPRYIPLALVPFLSPIDVIVRELERSVKQGHRGIVMLADPGILIKGRSTFTIRGGIRFGPPVRIWMFRFIFMNPAASPMTLPIRAGAVTLKPSFTARSRFLPELFPVNFFPTCCSPEFLIVTRASNGSRPRPASVGLTMFLKGAITNGNGAGFGAKASPLVQVICSSSTST